MSENLTDTQKVESVEQQTKDEFDYDREPKKMAELRTALSEITNPEEKEKNSENNSEIKSEVTSEQVVHQESEIEKQARALGWRPKGEYTGQHYVEPEEYVRRQPLFEKIERQSFELRELRDLVKQSTSHLTNIRKEAYQQAIREFEQTKLKAVEEGDTVKYKNADVQAQELQKQMATDPIINTPVPKQEIPADLQHFLERNSTWYNGNSAENAKMKAAADAVDAYLYNEAQIDKRQINIKEHLAKIESEVKRLFPNRFPNQETPKVASVTKTTSTKEPASSGNSLVSKLTSQQRSLGEKFQRSNPKYTLEMYAKDLESIGRLGKN